MTSAPHLSSFVHANGVTYVSGQLPFRKDGTLADDIAAQTEQVFENLQSVLREAGLGLENVVKVGVYLTSADDFVGFSEVYRRRFGDYKPARSTVLAGLVAAGARIEIDAIAVANAFA